MPTEGMSEFENAFATVEIRKIKIGKKGSKKYPERLRGINITMPLKASGGTTFVQDKEAMCAVWRLLGKDYSVDEWKGDVPYLPRIPVRLFNDDVLRNIHIYRGWYGGSGPRCTSTLGQENAKRYINTKAWRDDKKLVVLKDGPKDVPCNKECSLWVEPGQKSDCGWRAVSNMQLEVMPVLPNKAVFRTSGWVVMQHMVGSLNTLRQVTGGILTGIPLWLCWYEIESKTADGTRKHPIMSFEYIPTGEEVAQFGSSFAALRARAAMEVQSRMNLKGVAEGSMSISLADMTPKQLTSGAMIALPPGGTTETVSSVSVEDEEDDELILDDDDDEAPAAKVDDEAEKVADELLGKVESLRQELGHTDKYIEMLFDKEGGDAAAVVAELEKMKSKPSEPPEPVGESDGGDFSPGDPVEDDGFLDFDEEEDEEEEKQAAEEPKEEEEETPEPDPSDLFGDDDDLIFDEDPV